MAIHVSSSGRFHSGTGGSFGKVPPVGTSAYKAYQRSISADPFATANPYSFSPKSSSGQLLYPTVLGNTNFAGSAFDNALTSILRGDPVEESPAKPGPGSSDPVNPGPGPVRPVNSGSASSISTGILAPSTIDYLNADLAKHYGMSRETAYAEAMENTAYKRAVADMQSAGLNPAVIFGAGRGQTAGTPSYIRSDRSAGPGGSGGSSSYSFRRYSSGKSSNNGKLFDSGVYAVMSALGGVAGALATKSAGGFWIGTSIAQASMSAANLLSRAISK